ncbi:hypothetical protein VaNZ11_011413 [Volvox africanus]|uniref:MutL C-terminal dimerisation domain-containing protein n=1 Tax=Volvox africanus TaxID=51714 RepID=A0ABQ5SD34_9CHLO|nr:hypothetical protein VaNZ11_011413 [Volvox africanus]
MLPVRQLPKSLVDRIRTGLTLNSLDEAIAELLANSIDAEASNVHISLNAEALSFTVEDDGRGIHPDDVNALGGRYCTSKIRSMADFQAGVRTLGFRGEAICSLFSLAADVCVTTRARGTFVTLVKHVQCGGTKIRTGPSTVQLAHSGTTISVKRFLFNQPVRQRQLAGQHRDLEACTIEAVLRMALPFADVGVTLLRATTGLVLLHLPQGRNVATTFLRLVTEYPPSSPLLSVSGSKGYRASAVLGSLTMSWPHPHHQYMYVNRRHVRSLPLAALLNEHFLRANQQAGFRHAARDCKLGDPVERRGISGTVRGASCSPKVLPVFLVLLECPYFDYDVTAEPDKSDVIFKQLPLVQHLLRSLAAKAWGPAGLQSHDDEGSGTTIAAHGDVVGNQSGPEKVGPSGTGEEFPPKSQDLRVRNSHVRLQDKPVLSQTLAQHADKQRCVATGNEDVRAAQVHRPLRALLQLQASARASQLAQSRTMSLAAVMAPEKDSEEAEDACKRNAAQKESGCARVMGLAYTTRQGSLFGGPNPHISTAYNTMGHDNDAVHKNGWHAGGHGVTARQTCNAEIGFGAGGVGGRLFRKGAQHDYATIADLPDGLEDDPLCGDGQLGVSIIGEERFAGADIEWRHVSRLTVRTGLTDMRLAASPELGRGRTMLTLHDSRLMATSPSFDCPKSTSNQHILLHPGDTPTPSHKVTEEGFAFSRGNQWSHGGLESKHAARTPPLEGELGSLGHDVIPGSSPITLSRARPQQMLKMPGSDACGYRDGTWQSPNELIVPMRSAQDKARNFLNLGPLGKQLMECSSPRPLAAKASPDDSVTSFRWVGDGDGLAQAVPCDNFGREYGDCSEDLSWAKGLSPDTIDGIVHLRMRLQLKCAGRSSASDDSNKSQALENDCQWGLQGDIPSVRNDLSRGHTCDQMEISAATDAATAAKKAQIPNLPKKGDALCMFLSDLGNSPHEVTTRKSAVPRSRSTRSGPKPASSWEGLRLTGAFDRHPAGSVEPFLKEAIKQVASAPKATVSGAAIPADVPVRRDCSFHSHGAVPPAADEGQAVAVPGQLLEGRNSQQLIVGMALPAGDSSYNDGSDRYDEGSLSQLAKFLNFANVDSEMESTPAPHSAVVGLDQVDVIEVSSSANEVPSIIDRTPVGQRCSGSSVRTPMRTGHFVNAQAKIALGTQFPGHCGSDGSMGEPVPEVSTPSDGPIPKARSAPSTSAGPSTAPISHKHSRAPQLVQSSPPHAKKRSRVVHMELCGRLALSQCAPVLSYGSDTLDEVSRASAPLPGSEAVVTRPALESEPWADESMRGATSDNARNPNIDTASTAIVTAGATTGTPSVCQMALLGAADVGTSGMYGARSGPLGVGSGPGTTRLICSFVWPVKQAILGLKHRTSQAEQAPHRNVRRVEEDNVSLDDAYCAGKPRDPNRCCTEKAAANPIGVRAVTVQTIGERHGTVGALAKLAGAACSNMQCVIEQGCGQLRAQGTCAAGSTPLTTSAFSIKGSIGKIQNADGLQEGLAVDSSGLGTVLGNIAGILRKRALSSMNRTPKRVRFHLPSGPHSAPWDDAAGSLRPSEPLPFDFDRLGAEQSKPDAGDMPAGHELLQQQPRVAPGDGTVATFGGCMSVAASTSCAAPGKPLSLPSSKAPGHPSGTEVQPLGEVAAAVSELKHHFEEQLQQKQLLSRDEPLTNLPSDLVRPRPVSIPFNQLRLELPESSEAKQIQLIYNQDEHKVLSLELDLLRLVAPGELLVPSDVSRPALAGLASGTMQQVDRKFIPAMASGGNLLIVDQHAAHERVRLEQLTNQLNACVIAVRSRAAAHGASRRDIGIHGGMQAAITIGRQSAGGGHVVGAEALGVAHASGQRGFSISAGVEVTGAASEVLSVHRLTVPLKLQLAISEAATLERHMVTVAAWGWRVRTAVRNDNSISCHRSCSAAAVKKLRLEGTTTDPPVPGPTGSLDNHLHLLIDVPSVCGVTLTNPMDLRLYLHQLHETEGADLPPPAVLRVLRSKACRTAIMFGDSLAREQCIALLAQLRNTRLWTQCAHGRPTVAPLVHLPTLRAVLARRHSAAQLTGASSHDARDGGARRQLSVAALQAAIRRNAAKVSG